MSRRARRDPKDTMFDLVREDAYMRQILQGLSLLGYLVYHTYDSRRCDPGFPDIVAVPRAGSGLPPVVWFIEVKTQRGRIRKGKDGKPGQDDWLAALGAATAVRVRLSRPRDADRLWEELGGRGA